MRLTLIATVAAVALFCQPREAHASTITWQYNLSVHGTVVTGPFQEIAIPLGTRLTIQVTFDTTTPTTFCTGNSRVYLLGGNNAVTIDFLGYRYSASGGIEINGTGLGGCGAGFGSGVRLYFGGTAQQIDPSGTEIPWSPTPNGTLYLPGLPPSDWLGEAWPATLPPQGGTYSGGFFFGTSNTRLTIDSGSLQAVPEPTTGALVGIGALVVALRTKQRRSRAD